MPGEGWGSGGDREAQDLVAGLQECLAEAHPHCSIWAHVFPFLLSLYLRVPLPCQGLPRWHRIHLPMQEMQETLVRSLGQEDPLEKRMATYSSILAWRIPWTEEPGRLQSMGLRSQTRLSQHTLPHCVSRKDPVFPSPWVLISAVDL